MDFRPVDELIDVARSEEIALFGDFVLAASCAGRHLTPGEVDQILGLGTATPEQARVADGADRSA